MLLDLLVQEGCDPRPPRGRRPDRVLLDLLVQEGCDPRPPRGRRRIRDQSRKNLGRVAIHAPLAGGDAVVPLVQARASGCDPRPPRGRRLGGYVTHLAGNKLRSTPPSREATIRKGDGMRCDGMLRSTPPSREATATLARSARDNLLRSTPPSREATRHHGGLACRGSVAIHAPLAGGDARHPSCHPPS